MDLVMKNDSNETYLYKLHRHMCVCVCVYSGCSTLSAPMLKVIFILVLSFFTEMTVE